ncbi:MAG: hypothetical protein K2L14_02735 [Duncaniella sp.]|nr:hypothetical protein [Duncaniella sp.]
MNCNTMNAHARDGFLHFDEAAHRYTLHGRELKSVTTMVQEAFPEFNAPYWAARKAPDLHITPEELMARWEATAAEARRLGTEMHSRIERYYLGETGVTDDGDAMANFRSFASCYRLNPFRTEWRIYHEEYGVAGTLDFLDLTDDRYTIWDWKRSVKLVDPTTGQPRLPGRFTATGTHPHLSHVPDTSFYHYALQLSVYRIILQEKYGIEVDGQYLGVFHPANPRYYVMPVPFMRAEALALMQSHPNP